MGVLITRRWMLEPTQKLTQVQMLAMFLGVKASLESRVKRVGIANQGFAARSVTRRFVPFSATPNALRPVLFVLKAFARPRIIVLNRALVRAASCHATNVLPTLPVTSLIRERLPAPASQGFRAMG